MPIIKTFPDRYINKLATTIMLDEQINKMLYYADVLNKDIYSLEEVDNPIAKLKNKNVFINRRVTDLFTKVNEADIYVFINLHSDAPCNINGRSSTFIDTMSLDIGVICSDSCRNTLNGTRENIVFDRIVELLKTDINLQGIGVPKISNTNQAYAIPLGYNMYIITVTINYFNTM